MNRKQKRQNLKDSLKQVTREKLIYVIEKHLDLIFDITYHYNVEGKEDIVIVAEYFDRYIEHFYTNTTGCIKCYDWNVYRLNKRQLLNLYKKTSKAAVYICDYHGLDKKRIQ